MNLCIVCARCVRACDEIRGDRAISLYQKSGRSLIGTSQGTSLLESGCEFCGACIDVCPTGALVERMHKWDKAVKIVNTTCNACPVGCRVNLEVDKRNRVIRVLGDRLSEVNQGQLCFRGKFGLYYVNNTKDVIKKPLVRKSGQLVETTWDEAIGTAAERLAAHKGSEYAMVVDPRGTNEDAYIAQKFARVVMQSNNVDVASNVRPELAQALRDVLGQPAATNSLADLERSRSFLIVSSNITEEQNVAAVFIKKALASGAKLVVIDQRETEISRHADVWLRPHPGTESTLIGGMLRVMIDESLDDHDFLADHCEDVAEFKNNAWDFDLIRVESITGVPQAQVQAAARAFASRKPGAILYALETVAPELRESCVKALVNTALVTGNIGKPSAGLFPLYLGANEQGAKDVGCAPDTLPGYRRLASERARERVKSAWQTDVPTEPGVAIRGLTRAIEDGKIKALHLMGDNANFTNGELGDFIEALKMLDFLIVQDMFHSEITEHADIVLPSAHFAMRAGTLTNMERRVQLLAPAVGPKGEEEPDWMIVSRIARQMGAHGFDHSSAEAVFDEISNIVGIYGGMTYERLASEEGLQWPCLAADMSDTAVLYETRMEGQKPCLVEMEIKPAPARDREEYPFLLAMGRVLHQPEREPEIETVRGRHRLSRKEIVEIHPSDARDLKVAEGEYVTIQHAGGTLSGIASVHGTQRGIVSITTLFGELITALESSKAPDPMLKLPSLPLLPVKVSRAVATVAAD